MPEQAIKEQLETLHRVLSEHPQMDEETRNLMRQVAEDIDSIDTMEEAQANDLASTLEEHVVRFDHDYPTLAAVVRQVIDTLGRIGV